MKRKIALLLACGLVFNNSVNMSAQEEVMTEATVLSEKEESTDAAEEYFIEETLAELKASGTEISEQEEVVPEDVILLEDPDAVATEAENAEEAADVGDGNTVYSDVEMDDLSEEVNIELIVDETQKVSGVELDAVEGEENSVIINETNFPDKKFRSYVCEKVDLDQDAVLGSEEIQAVVSINVDISEIHDLTGIEYFTEIRELSCAENYLTSLDVSQNTALTYLNCGGNELSNLDVSHNTALTYLNCGGNELRNLDVSQNTALTYLNCDGNELGNLDVSQNTALTYLNCGWNELRNLDVSQNTALTYLNCRWTELSNLDVSQNTALTYLDCSYNELNSLAISQNTVLNWLECENNKLRNLDVSQNTALTYLNCDGNELHSLDVSHNVALEELYCSDNNISALYLGSLRLRFAWCAIQSVPALDQLLPCENGWRLNMAELIGRDNLSNIREYQNKEKIYYYRIEEGEWINVSSEKPSDDYEIICVGEWSDDYLIFTGTERPESAVYHYDTKYIFDETLYESDYSYDPEILRWMRVELQFGNNSSCTHSYSPVITKQPTCGTDGSQYERCTICGVQKPNSTTVIPATGKHEYTVKTVKEATCGRTGTKQEVCKVCGTVKQNSIVSVPATGKHTYGAWKVTQSATALKAGIKSRVCSVCGYTEHATIAKLTPTIVLNTTSLILKVKQSTTALKVTGLAKGDSIASWKSGNTSIVKVDSKTGKITAQNKTGKATVTVTLASGKTAKVTVTVQKTTVKTTKISGLASKIKLEKGSKTTLNPVLTPITSQEKVTYKSSNQKIATVSSKGVITAKTAGTAKITVTSGKKKFTVTVTVPKVATEKITNVKTSMTIKKGKSYTLKPKLTPANSDDKITYSSSNKKVATVDSKGKITGKKKGTATITVKAGKKKVTCKVTVK